MKRCIVLLCLPALVLTGCWSRKEPKDLAIATSAIYDLGEDNSYVIYHEFMNVKDSSQGMGTQRNSAIIEISQGESLPEALRNVSETIERELFGAHLDVRFISERFARSNALSSLMDFVLRDHLTNMKPFLVVVKGDHPEELYPALHGYSDYAGDYILSLSDNQPKSTAKGVFVTTYEFMRDYYTEGLEPVMGVIELSADTAPSENTQGSAGSSQGQSQNQTKIVYEGLAVFKDNKLVGFLDGGQTRIYNILANRLEGDYVSNLTDESATVVLITRAVTQIDTDVREGVAFIDIHVEAIMTLKQAGDVMDFADRQTRQSVEDELSRTLEEQIAATVGKVQREFGSDIFGFGQQVHIQHPDVWKRIKSDWDAMFPAAEVHVTVESAITRLGESEKSYAREEP